MRQSRYVCGIMWAAATGVAIPHLPASSSCHPTPTIDGGPPIGSVPLPTCVIGSPFTDSHWDINYALVSIPAHEIDSLSGFEVVPGWCKIHALSESVGLTSYYHSTKSVDGVHGQSLQITSEEWFAYGEFKCQFACDAAPNCVSFTGRKGDILRNGRGAVLTN